MLTPKYNGNAIHGYSTRLHHSWARDRTTVTTYAVCPVCLYRVWIRDEVATDTDKAWRVLPNSGVESILYRDTTYFFCAQQHAEEFSIMPNLYLDLDTGSV